MKNTQNILLQIAHLGHPVLRKKASRVTNIDDASTQQLIDNLIATVMDVNGVGIAAPQVYVSQRIFIMASHPNPRYPNAPYMKPTPVINPEIISVSQETEKDWEGCLSIPGIRGHVPRARNIQVLYTDRNGKKIKREFSGFTARIFQHEYDHIEGTVFLDRVLSSHDLISEKEYQRLMEKPKIKVKKRTR